MNLWDYRVQAALGGLLWGCWALFVNWEAGLPSASLSAVTQATVSAGSITFLLLLTNRVLGLRWGSPVLQVVAGAILPYSVLLAVVVTAHLIVHTHDIFFTILPSASIGILYNSIYAYKNRNKYARRRPD